MSDASACRPRQPARRAGHRVPLVAGLAATLALGMAAVAPSADAKPVKQPDLLITRASVGEARVVEGGTITVTHQVRNKGKKTAGRSTTRFFLSTSPAASLADRRASRANPRTSIADVPLGVQAVGKVKRGKKRNLSATRLAVPVGLPPATYGVLACADDTGIVREGNEANNCRVAGSVALTAAPGTEQVRLQQFADTATSLPDEGMALDFVKIWCSVTTPARALSLSGAVASAQKFLAANAGADALTQLAKSGQADTALDAERLAGTAALNDAPGLALAALLRAHQLEPNNANHLVNAGAVATSIGLPNEAIAFTDAALARPARRTPLAIPLRATALTVRAEAMVRTGQAAAAEPLFRQARTLAPLLSEADTGLGTIAACQGKAALAKRYLRRGRIRSVKPEPTPPTTDPTRPAPALDQGQGVAATLRHIPIPETPAHEVELDPVFKGIEQGFHAEIDARNQAEDELQAKLDADDEQRTRAEIDRRNGIMNLAYQSYLASDVVAQQDAFDELGDQLQTMREDFWGGGTGEAPYTHKQLIEDAAKACQGSKDPDCFDHEMNRTCRPALSGANAAYSVKLAALQTTGDALLAAWSKRVSGYAANLVTPEARSLLQSAIESYEMSIHASVVQAAQMWTHDAVVFEEQCVEPMPPSDPAEDDGVTSAGLPEPCSAGGNKISYKFGLGPTSVKVNCESVTQSFTSEAVIPLLHAFVEIKYDMRSGGLTVVAGAKGALKVGGVVDMAFKSGMYIKSDNRGNIKDVGMRVGPSANVVDGKGLEFGAYKDEIDISFVPVFTSGP
ncbi:MAG TPA: CARDB domain-containing protein [Nocardioides sp.]|nr:CARDB domain-containing protein [Nocardioides sp.]